MIDPHSRAGGDLKAAEEFYALAKTAASPYVLAYYWRAAVRYLSPEGELRSLPQRQSNFSGDLAPQQIHRWARSARQIAWS
jgi:hypothetical protein